MSFPVQISPKAEEKLVFNAQKFHIDDPVDLDLYHQVMRKYADHLLCSEKYFNKSSELFVYIEWMGEDDYHEEFVNKRAPVAAPPVAPQKAQTLAKSILRIADKKENSDDGS